jgi:hypothetical protein
MFFSYVTVVSIDDHDILGSIEAHLALMKITVKAKHVDEHQHDSTPLQELDCGG